MDKPFDELSLAKSELAKNIIGEMVLSNSPEKVMKKWRNLFKVSQKELANCLGITSSVISDYESGRRSSPGIKFVKRYVNALLKLDEQRSGKLIKSFSFAYSKPISKAVVDLREFAEGADILDFCKSLQASLLVRGMLREKIYGYTIIDSVKAITELSFSELIKLYGITTQRALIFTGVSTGKGPLIAIKVTNLHPGLVILHGLQQADEIAINIAEIENIPLALCRLESVEDIIERLKEFR